MGYLSCTLCIILFVLSLGAQTSPTPYAYDLQLSGTNNSTVPPSLFLELEELSRLVGISYCVGYQGIQYPFECLSHCSDFKGFELVEVCVTHRTHDKTGADKKYRHGRQAFWREILAALLRYRTLLILSASLLPFGAPIPSPTQSMISRPRQPNMCRTRKQTEKNVGIALSTPAS